jgi:hypothetical protein
MSHYWSTKKQPRLRLLINRSLELRQSSSSKLSYITTSIPSRHQELLGSTLSSSTNSTKHNVSRYPFSCCQLLPFHPSTRPLERSIAGMGRTFRYWLIDTRRPARYLLSHNSSTLSGLLSPERLFHVSTSIKHPIASQHLVPFPFLPSIHITTTWILTPVMIPL